MLFTTFALLSRILELSIADRLMVEFIVLYGIDSDDVLRFLLLPLFLPMILTSSMWFAYDTVLHLLNGTNEIQIERFK